MAGTLDRKGSAATFHPTPAFKAATGRELIKQHYGSSRKSAPRERTQPKKKAPRELASTKR